MYDSDERVRELVDTAKAIEGMPRNTSTHAAGVVITKLPVYDYVPLATNDGTIVTEYTLTTHGGARAPQMDFLGLRNITVIDDAIRDIRKTEPDFSMARVTDNDPKVMDMLTQGRTARCVPDGIDRYDGRVHGPEAACRLKICPSSSPPTGRARWNRSRRLIACKQDPSLVKYKHPMLQPILSVTYGCILYQEQVIEIFRQLAGFSLGQADMIRRAMSKKKEAVITAERAAFVHGDPARSIPGAVARGVPEQTANDIYDEILAFASYAFNKAHAVSYAIVSYRTAYMKRNYPHEYMAALLTSVLDNTPKVTEYIAECRELGIRLLPPDINASDADFTVENGDLRFASWPSRAWGAGSFRRSCVSGRSADRSRRLTNSAAA